MIDMLEGKVDDIVLHKGEKENIREIYPNWDEAYAFMQDVIQNDAYRGRDQKSPFKAKDKYSFEDVTRIAQRLSEDFGPASNHECGMIKDQLAAMDVHATGRVKLSDFYAKSQGGGWQFGE